MNVGQRTVPVPLAAGEFQIYQTYGAVGRTAGGIMLVTNYRVIFQPWDMSLAQTLIKYGGKALGIPHAGVVNYVVGKLVGIVDATAQGVGDIVSVESVGTASWFSLPKVRVWKSDDTYAEFGVVATPTTPNISDKNNQTRDALVAQIYSTFLS